MKKILFTLSCGLLSAASLFGAYAADGEVPSGPFNPPKNVDFGHPGQPFSNSEQQKTLEKLQHYQQQMQQASADLGTAIGECKESYEVRRIKTHAKLATCYNEAVMTVYRHTDYPYMDLVQAVNDKRLEIGENIDKKMITEDQGEVELNQFSAGKLAQENRRNNELMKGSVIFSSND